MTQTSAGPYGSRAARARSRVRTASSWLRGASRTVRREERQGSSAAWCSVSKTKTSHPSGRAPTSRLRGVGGGAGEEELVAGAAAEEGGDGGPALLEEVGGELGEVPGAPVDAAVVGGVGGHVVPDPLEGGGAGGVVEGGVGALPAGGERDGHVGAQNGQRGTNRRFGDGVDGGGGHGYSRSGVRRGVWRRPAAKTEKGVRGGGNRGPGPGSYPEGTASLPGRRRPREEGKERRRVGPTGPNAFACSREPLPRRTRTPGHSPRRGAKSALAADGLTAAWSSPGAPRHGRRVAGQRAGAVVAVTHDLPASCHTGRNAQGAVRHADRASGCGYSTALRGP